MGPFLGVFEELSTFLAPKWPLATLGTILRGQKSIELLKNPSKGPIKCFSRIKNKLSRTCRISSILIVTRRNTFFSTERLKDTRVCETMNQGFLENIVDVLHLHWFLRYLINTLSCTFENRLLKQLKTFCKCIKLPRHFR